MLASPFDKPSLRRWVQLRVVMMIFLALAFVPSSRAQTTDSGSIEGIATDPSGAVVAGTLVKARLVQTSATFTAVTNDDGLFQFPVLAPGAYELTAERAGFAPLILKDVVVTVGARVSLPLTLQLSVHSESVVVSGGAPIIESTRSHVSTTVDTRLIDGLPVSGRDFTHFILLTPGVTTEVRGPAIIAGQGANGMLVDGFDENDSFFGQPLGGEGFSNLGAGTSSYEFSQEAVQEFQVNTNSYSAELGRALGGVTSVVTKAGTNQLHGSALWFYRDRSMNANDMINKRDGQPKGAYHFNQYGGTFAGPLVKSKLLFLFNYEGLRSNKPNTVILNLPNGFHLDPDPQIAAYQQRALDYLVPRATSWVLPIGQDTYFTRFDWHITRAHSLTARWNHHSGIGGAGGSSVSFENRITSGGGSNDVLTASLTSTFSTACVNVARLAYVQASGGGFRAHSSNPQADVFEGNQRVLTVGGETNRQEGLLHRLQASDTLAFVHGRHSSKLGVDVLSDWNHYVNAQNFFGSYVFRSLQGFGRSLAGVPMPASLETYSQTFSGVGTPGTIADPNVVDLAGFAQDEWRVGRNFTLNLGLRYDLQLSAKPPLKNPSPALAAAGIDTSALPTDVDNFGPRLGLAWAPLRDNRLVVRAGYGIFYSPTPAGRFSRAHFQNGITVQPLTFEGETSSAAFPAYPNNFCGAPDPSGLAPSCAPPMIGGGPIITPFPSNHSEAYTQQGSLGIELQLHRDFAASASYIVTKGAHLARTRDINLGATTPATVLIEGTNTILTYPRFTLPRPIAGFDRILLLENNANSIYHGLALQANKRFSNNFRFLASYTFSKLIDDNQNGIANPNAGGLLADPSNPREDRGPGDNDQRHRFVLSGVWDLNYANALPAAAKAIFGGWEVSGIFTAQSGHPYSGVVNGDLNNDGDQFNDRTPGVGRNTFFLPATISFDPRLTRNVHLTERAKLQFIWEAFNVFNRGNVTGANTTQYSVATCGAPAVPCLLPRNSGRTAFGSPAATSGPRIMQLAIKVAF